MGREYVYATVIGCFALVVCALAAAASGVHALDANSSTYGMMDAGIVAGGNLASSEYYNATTLVGIIAGTASSYNYRQYLGVYYAPENTNQSVQYCGDAICQSGESCSVCSSDCGSCPADDSDDPAGGGGGGGGGGGLGVPAAQNASENVTPEIGVPSGTLPDPPASDGVSNTTSPPEEELPSILNIPAPIPPTPKNIGRMARDAPWTLAAELLVLVLVSVFIVWQVRKIMNPGVGENHWWFGRR